MNKKKWVRVRVPASSANLGPGYDVLGIALKLYNEIELRVEIRNKEVRSEERKISVIIEGEGSESLPRDERNIVWQSAKKVFQLSSFQLSAFSFQLKLKNCIPLARGLGSSAAARLGGILAANSVCKNFLSRQAVLNLATRLEGHPDNVVPALSGGLCISTNAHGQVEWLRLAPPKNICAVVCIPDFQLSTAKARSVLPEKIPHRDAVYNLSRAALLLGALIQRNYSYLKIAMEDRLHQNYRKKLVPGFDFAIRNGYRAGALGIALSGAGPSLFAFAPFSKAKAVGRGLAKGFLKAGRSAESRILNFDSEGAKLF